MSVPITDLADNIRQLVDNLNALTTVANEQLDVSVLNNLTTDAKNTLVAAINELNAKKVNSEGNIHITGDIMASSFDAKTFKVGADENNNAYIQFLDVLTNQYVKLGWNGALQKWVVVDINGNISDIGSGGSGSVKIRRITDD